MIPAERIKPLLGETPAAGSMDWLWYVGDMKDPDTPKPEDADYMMFFKCIDCMVQFKAWRIRGKWNLCLWCNQPITDEGY